MDAMAILSIFVLSVFVGFEVVSKVSSPLIKIGVPPKCATAVSDASLVRVEGLVI